MFTLELFKLYQTCFKAIESNTRSIIFYLPESAIVKKKWSKDQNFDCTLSSVAKT